MKGKKISDWFLQLSKGKKIALCSGGIIVCLVAAMGIYVAAKFGKMEHQEIPKEKLW